MLDDDDMPRSGSGTVSCAVGVGWRGGVGGVRPCVGWRGGVGGVRPSCIVGVAGTRASDAAGSLAWRVGRRQASARRDVVCESGGDADGDAGGDELIMV